MLIHVQLTKVTGNCQYTNYCIQVVDLHHVQVWTQQKLLVQNTMLVFDNTIIFILANRLGRLSTAGTKVGSHKGKRGNCHFTIVFASIISFRKALTFYLLCWKNSNQTIFLLNHLVEMSSNLNLPEKRWHVLGYGELKSKSLIWHEDQLLRNSYA